MSVTWIEDIYMWTFLRNKRKICESNDYLCSIFHIVSLAPPLDLHASSSQNINQKKNTRWKTAMKKKHFWKPIIFGKNVDAGSHFYSTFLYILTLELFQLINYYQIIIHF